jgi:hypothetical protein
MKTSTTKICRHCKKEFNKLPKTSYKQWSGQFCCSKECGDKSKKTPWLKKHEIKKGQHLSPKTQFKSCDVVGKLNKKWKGDDAGYEAKHMWASKWFGRPQFCEHCKTSANRMYHWANISGEYKRDRNDWVRLCVPCHKKMDLNK